MSNSDPISLRIDEHRNANEFAPCWVWQHFSTRLHQMARQNLRAKTRPVYNEPDVVQSMFHSICQGWFPDRQDRDSLWRLMFVIAGQKIAICHRYAQQPRRDVSRTLTDSIFIESQADSSGNNLLSREPTPEFQQTTEVLLAALAETELKGIAMLRVEGYNDNEIANQPTCSRRTVQRRLTMIRRSWETSELLDG